MRPIFVRNIVNGSTFIIGWRDSAKILKVDNAITVLDWDMERFRQWIQKLYQKFWIYAIFGICWRDRAGMLNFDIEVAVGILNWEMEVVL